MREDGQHARLLLCRAGIEALDAAFGDGAGHEHAISQAGQLVFGGVLGSAGYFGVAIHPAQGLAYYPARYGGGRCRIVHKSEG